MLDVVRSRPLATPQQLVEHRMVGAGDDERISERLLEQTVRACERLVREYDLGCADRVRLMALANFAVVVAASENLLRLIDDLQFRYGPVVERVADEPQAVAAVIHLVQKDLHGLDEF